MFKLSDRVKQTSTTTGTNDIVFASEIAGFQTFAQGVGDGNSTYYAIENHDRFEIGIGTYTSSTNTLSRDTVLISNNSNNKIILDGVSSVFVTYPAAKSVNLDSLGFITGFDADYAGIKFPDGTTQSTAGGGGTGQNYYVDEISLDSSNILTLGRVALADLTVDLSGLSSDIDIPESGNWNTAYNVLVEASGNWNTAYGWGDHSLAGYLTTISIPESGNWNTAYDTLVAQSGNWNTAYGWGDHSTAGYLTEINIPESGNWNTAYDTLVEQSGNWNTAYGWGDHSIVGYLTEISIPESGNWNTAYDTLVEQSGNWNTAYGWGDHSVEGYLTTISIPESGNWNTAYDTLVQQSGNWNTAYSWGDHSVEGYLTTINIPESGNWNTAYDTLVAQSGNWNTAYSWGDHSVEGYLTSFTEVNDLSAAVTWVTVPDLYISESSVVQHSGAMRITESQIVDLQTYLTAHPSITNNGSSNSNTGNTFIQNITLDSNGHITNLSVGVSTVGEDAEGIASILEDTTPQLGGQLDANGYTIDMGNNIITDAKVGQWDTSYSTLVAQSGNWNTAYSWGDHSTEGYLTTIDIPESGNWNTAYDTLVAQSGNWNTSYDTLVAQSGNWNTAYSWGDHSVEGYLTEINIPESGNWNTAYDTLVAQSGNWNTSYDTLVAQSGNWNTAYSWGDHSVEGYLTTINIPESGNWNTAYNTLVEQSGNWNTAYSWGDHSVEGYLTAINIPESGNWNTAYDVLVEASGNWNTAYGWGDHSTAGYLTSFTETLTTLVADSVNQKLVYTDEAGSSNDVDLSWLVSTGLTGNGSSNYVARWTSSTTLGSGLIYDDLSGVGIGTTNPGVYRLRVVGGHSSFEGGNVKFDGGNVTVNEAGGNYDFRVQGDSQTHLLFTDASTDTVNVGSTNDSYSKLYLVDTQTDKNAGSASPTSRGIGIIKNDYTTITSTQYAQGINVRSEKHVSSGITDSGYVIAGNFVALHDSDGTLNEVVGLRSNAGGYYSHSGVIENLISFKGVPVNLGGGTITNSYGLYLSTNPTSTNSYGVYQAGPNDTNYFAASVGIGTNSPTNVLDIVATGVTEGITIRGTNAPGLTLHDNGGAGVSYASGGSKIFEQASSLHSGVLILDADTNNVGHGSYMSLRVDGTEHVQITEDGNVGIGTTDPANRLYVAGGDGTAYIQSGIITPSIAFRTADIPKTGATIYDGFIAYQNSDCWGLGNDLNDGFVFEKTDGNAAIADGGIFFNVRGNDGVSSTAMSINGRKEIFIGQTGTYVAQGYSLNVAGGATFADSVKVVHPDGACGLMVEDTGGSGVHIGDCAYLNGSTYTGMKHSAHTNSSEYMIISRGDWTLLSGKDGYGSIIRGGNNNASSEIRVYDATNGTNGVVINEQGSDVDTRIEGANEQNLFKVDASEDKIGIATSTPSSRLEVLGAGSTTDEGIITVNDPSSGGTTSWIKLHADDGFDDLTWHIAYGDTSMFRDLEFRTSFSAVPEVTIEPSSTLNLDSGGTSTKRFKAYDFYSTTYNTAALPAYTFANDLDTGMWLASANNLCFSTAGTERLRISSAGNVGINTSNPLYTLDIVGGARIEPTTSDGMLLGRSGGTRSIRATGADAPSEYLILDSNGNYLSLNHYTSDNVVMGIGGGNVGIATTVPTEKLQIQGNIRLSNGGIGTDNDGVHMAFPGNGSDSNTTSVRTGYLKVQLPVGWTNTMISFDLYVYEYNANNAAAVRKFRIGGYNYAGGGGQWTRPIAVYDGDGLVDHNLKVHFGYDGTYSAIYISKMTTAGVDSGASSSWSYPQAFVANVFGGYSATTMANWADGWDINYTTALGTISQTLEVNRSFKLNDSSYVFNDLGNNVDVRIESENLDYLIHTDASKDEVVIHNAVGYGLNYATSEGWIEGNGTQVGYYGGNFTRNGAATENFCEFGDLPNGLRGLIWKSRNNTTDNSADGGWTKNVTGVDPEKTYVSIVYVRRVGSSTTGSFYHGCGTGGSATLEMNGTSNGNPYFHAFNIAQLPQDVWCVSIGIIHAHSDPATTSTGIGGIYRLDTGVKTGSYTNKDYRMGPTATVQNQRTFLYYDTAGTSALDWCWPGFYEITADAVVSLFNTILYDPYLSGRDIVVNAHQDNYDFRVAGDTDSHLLFTDASTDRVGIGNTNPSEKLSVTILGSDIAGFHTTAMGPGVAVGALQSLKIKGIAGYDGSRTSTQSITTEHWENLGASATRTLQNLIRYDSDYISIEDAYAAGGGTTFVPRLKINTTTGATTFNEEFTFPTTDGSANQVLVTDGAGSVTWEDQSTSSGGGMQAGSVVWVATTSAPTGYLKANGAAISRTTYADLFAIIGTSFGAGDGSTTFNIPDLRGEFIRGWDDGRGIDTGRSIATSQTDDFKEHEHGIRLEHGNYPHSYLGRHVPPNGQYLAVNGAGNYPYSKNYGHYNGTKPIEAVGGDETRPRNIALLACIKY
jgi:hypothetical protein